MFDKLKNLKQLKDLYDNLEKEKIEIEKQGIKVVINGRLEIENISLNPELSKEKEEEILKECFNEAIRKVQMKFASKNIGNIGSSIFSL